jgi:ubiquinone/menaquinone biosynthesis C-methylase UbiE
MDWSEYQNIYNNEDAHFYYVAVHEAILQALRKVIPGRKDARLLDAGCGTGWLASKLSEFGTVDAIDLHEEALKLSRSRGVNATRATVEEIPFADNSFDVVTSVDVIYHQNVSDDVKALREMFRVLKPGGWLVMRVPAHQCLYSTHDKFVKTARRYTIPEMNDKLTNACFQLRSASYCQATLFMPAWIKAQMEKMSKTSAAHSTIDKPNPVINGILTMVLRAENLLLRCGVAMPFGIGVLVVARKPTGTTTTLRKLALSGRLKSAEPW